jgi:hypothetical protein
MVFAQDYKYFKVEVKDNKVFSISYPQCFVHKDHLQQEDDLISFIIRLNNILISTQANKVYVEDIDKAIFDKRAAVAADYKIVPKHITFRDNYPPNPSGNHIEIDYQVIKPVVNFDLQAVKKAAEEINPYFVWEYRFSLGTTNWFQLYTGWTPSIRISINTTLSQLHFYYGEHKGWAKEFEHTVDLKDCTTKSILVAIEECNNLRVEFNNKCTLDPACKEQFKKDLVDSLTVSPTDPIAKYLSELEKDVMMPLVKPEHYNP